MNTEVVDDEFSYTMDRGMVADPSDKDQQAVDPADYKKKLASLTRMWNLLGRPYNTPEEMATAMIVVGSRGEIFVWDEIAEKYEFWFAKDDLWSALKAFAPSFHKGTRWPTRSNIFIRQNFTFSAKKIDFHMTSYGSSIDPEMHTAWISCLHKTRHSPTYHADVQEWLEAFGGESKDKLLDWLASFAQLNRSTCMLYICGSKGIGKNLLAESLAQIWGGFADWEDRASDYQSDMGRNPFIWANEEMEKPRRTSIMSAIRRVIAGGNQRINEKNRPAYGMQCYYRLLVTANNPDLLKSWANMSTDDVEAVRERVGYFYASVGGRVCLERLAKQRGIPLNVLTTEFAEGKIAQHVLWLSQNRELPNANNQRLLVEGWKSDVTDKLEYETPEAFLMANAFNYTIHHSAKETTRYLKKVGEDYWINYTSMIKEWDEISLKRADEVRWKQMRDFVKLICTDDKKRMRPSSYDNPVYYYKIDSSKLVLLLVSYGFDLQDAQDIVKTEEDVVITLETLSEKNQDDQDLGFAIDSMKDSLDKTLLEVVSKVYAEVSNNEKVAITKTIIANLTEEVDAVKLSKMKVGSRILALLRDEVDTQNWVSVTKLIKEVYVEQMGYNGSERVHRSESSNLSGGWSDRNSDF